MASGEKMNAWLLIKPQNVFTFSKLCAHASWWKLKNTRGGTDINKREKFEDCWKTFESNSVPTKIGCMFVFQRSGCADKPHTLCTMHHQPYRGPNMDLNESHTMLPSLLKNYQNQWAKHLVMTDAARVLNATSALATIAKRIICNNMNWNAWGFWKGHRK